MKRIAILIPVLFASAWVLTACFLNDNAATASMHNSDNRLAMEQARNDRLQAEAQAQADAKIAVANEETQQQLYMQHGTSERLYAQGQYLAAINAQNAANVRFTLAIFLAVFLAAGGVALWLYVRENPKPRPWGPQYLPQMPPVQQLPTMPYSIAVHPQTRAAGWIVDLETGSAVHPEKGIVMIEDKQL